ALDPGLVRGVHALSDVRRLLTNGHVHTAGVAVEALGRGVVPDLEDLLPHDRRDVNIRLGGDLAGHVHLPGGHQRLHRHPRPRIRGPPRTEVRVTDRIADLLRMPLRHGLTGAQPAVDLPHDGSLPPRWCQLQILAYRRSRSGPGVDDAPCQVAGLTP